MARRLAVAAHLFWLVTTPAHSAPFLMGMRSPDFNAPAIGPSYGQCEHLIPLPDGRLILGGYFSLANGLNRPGIVALTPSGKLDVSFRPPFAWDSTPWVSRILPQPGPTPSDPVSLLVLGDFYDTNYNRLPRLFRLRDDGTIDPAFELKDHYAGANDFIVQKDGTILAVGYFWRTFTNGVVEIQRLARLSRDGAFDPSFVPEPIDFDPHFILGGPDGSAFLGSFQTNRIARFRSDGQRDWSVELPPGVQTRVRPTVDSEGRLYLLQSSNIVRLQSTGEIDPTFSPKLPPGGFSTFTSIFEWHDDLFLAGFFGGSPGLNRLLPDGTPDPAFESTVDPIVGPVAVHNDMVYAITGSPLTSTGNETVLAGIDTNGTVRSQSAVTLQSRGTILALIRQSSGKLLAHATWGTGSSTMRLLHDGTPDTNASSLMWIEPLAALPGDSFYGSMTLLDSNVISRILRRYDANDVPDPLFAVELEPYGPAAVQTNDASIIFAKYAFDGPVSSSLRRSWSDGTPDPDFAAGVTSLWVQAILPLSSGETLVTGSFFTEAGLRDVIQLNADGTLDPSFQVSQRVTWIVEGLAGQLIASIAAEPRLVRLLEDGAIDPSFNPVFGSKSEIVCAAVQPDGKTIVWGRLFDADNVRLPPVVRLDVNGAMDPMFQCDDTLNGVVTHLILEPSGDMIVGGTFAVPPDSGKTALVRLTKYPAPSFTSIRRDGPDMRLELDTIQGRTYRIESSTDLSNWIEAAEFKATNSSSKVVHPPSAETQFYRAVLVK